MNNILFHKNTNIRTADFSILNLLREVSMFPDKIAMFNSLKELGLENYVKVQAAALLLVRRGSVDVELDLKHYKLEAGSLFVVFPEQVVRAKNVSENFDPICIACSKNMIDELIIRFDDTTRLILKIRENPLMQLERVEFEQMNSSFEFLKKKFETTDMNSCRLQILKNYLIGLLYECIGMRSDPATADVVKSRGQVLFSQFIDLVVEHHREQHSVKFYADELGITPKYLSAVAEEQTGKNAKRWIDEHIALDAKVLLRSSSRDIQKVSKILNFPDVSFFGKFFKRLVGVSPKAYRKTAE
ncbi:helix-turn-helix domain-containing protein [Fibrobacter sp.]|uniref:helix-turn-helix domain-containing protein n=1 Tax=Fibrobacter sp. TaxID=35828 RepID=UPI0025BC38DF|nr:helix-turn-helix domain-containing protein [Fibrobacter sp.]MBR3073413.1 AraC family transcriptional regulator [Fibrobacter sp.]